MSDSKGKGVANGANVIDLVSPEGTVDAGGAGGSLAPPTHESISSGSSSVVVCKTASRAPKLDSSEGTADASGADGLLALPTHESIFISSGGSSVAVYPGSSKENLCPEAPDRKRLCDEAFADAGGAAGAARGKKSCRARQEGARPLPAPSSGNGGAAAGGSGQQASVSTNMSLEDRRQFARNITQDEFATSDKDLAESFELDFTNAQEAAVVRVHVPQNTPQARAAAAQNGQNQDNVEWRLRFADEGPLMPFDVKLAAQASNNVACSLLALGDKKWLSQHHRKAWAPLGQSPVPSCRVPQGSKAPCRYHLHRRGRV